MLRCRRCNQSVAMLGVVCICGAIAHAEHVDFTMPATLSYAAQPYDEGPHTHDEKVPPEAPRLLATQVSTSAPRPSQTWGIGWFGDEYWPNWQPPYPLVLRLASSTATS